MKKNRLYALAIVLVIFCIAVFFGIKLKLYACDGSKNHTVCMLTR